MVTLAEVVAAKKSRRRGRRAVVVPADVERLRKAYAHDFLPVATIAERFSVSVPTVYSVINGTGPYKYPKL
jgi:DNA invertase Pin-like site-specific DNA recombinase